MKKKILILLLCIGVIAASLCMGAAAFADIEDETTETAVATLESMGIVTGTSATKYSPSLTLTRAQVCAMMVRTKGLESSVGSYAYQSLFRDVKNSMWHAGYVNLAYNEGIISGYGNGYFGPDDDITYGQFVTMLLRLLGYTESDIGRIWPTDYIVFAADLGIDENVSLGANDKVSRGDAAILLYNTLMLNAKGTAAPYYRTIGGYASSVTAILLDNSVSSTTTGDLLAYVIDNSGATKKYYYQKNSVSDTFVGDFGTLLLNSSEKVIGFIPDGNGYADIIIDSAKLSGITDASGNTYKINGTAGVISSESIYSYSSTGYVKVNSHSGQAARFYYDDDGTVAYIYLTSGTDPSKAEVTVASSDAPVSEIEEALGITTDSYYTVKNGGRTDTAAITMYDVAYYDSMTNTLRVCDYKVTGYIEFASPSVSAAETITVSGCEIGVLQRAWDTLENFTLGSYVTVLLTDSGDVAEVYSAETLSEDMYGVLSTDGNSITLCGSGLVMKPVDISAKVSNNGALVKVDTSSSEKVVCSAVNKVISKTITVDLKEKTVGDIPLAPGCSIYECGGGYVYSLAGEYGKSSSDFSEIYWTDSLDYSYIDFYHVNNIGLVDILVLSEATGNYYEYGLLKVYDEDKGVTVGKLSYSAVTVTNDDYPNESQKYIYTTTPSGGYAGISVVAHSKSVSKIADISRLTVSKEVGASDFYLTDDDEWYAEVNGSKIPVNDDVKVYVKATGKWYSGSEGLLMAISSELELQVCYDRTLTTGAQIRIIIVEEK